MAVGLLMFQIRWIANPFRGDAFEEALLPIAEAALEYGATDWGFYRNADGRLDFIQEAVFPSKLDWERYWYSEEFAEVRERLTGWFQVPVVPTYWEVTGMGSRREAPTPS